MTIVERRLLQAILLRSGALTATAWWLVFAASLSRAAGVSGDDLGLASVAAAASSGHSSLDVAVTVCAPVGTLLAVRWLRRTGVLDGAMAAGLRPVRLVRTLAVAGVIAVLFVAAAQALTHDPVGSERPDDLLESGGAFAWSPPTASGRVVVFRADTLDVGIAEDAAAALDVDSLTPLFGRPVAMRAAGSVTGTGRPLDTPSLVRAVTQRRSLGTVLAAANRLLLAGCLVVLAGLLALAAPARRFWLAYVGLTALLSISAIAIVALSVQLWLGGAAGVGVQVLCAALAAALGIALFRRLARRGLHIE